MPIIVQGKQLDVKALSEALSEALEAKKQVRPKYTVSHKQAPNDKDYEEAKIVIGGEEKTLSKSSNFLLDMISEEE